MLYEQEEIKNLIKDIVIKNRENVPGRHTTSPHLYNIKEGVTEKGDYSVNFYSKGGVLHNCYIAFTVSDDGWVTCDHCWDKGMIELEEIVFSELEQHFRGEGIKTKLEFEDVIYKNRLRGRRRKLQVLDELLYAESTEEKPGETDKIHEIPVIPHDVFISYSSVDRTTALAVVSYLEKEGIRCWIAPRDVLPGISYQISLVNAIKTSDIMVLIFTSHSNRSEHVKREVNLAVSSGVTIIPFRIEHVPLSKEMEYLIATQHWLDALTPPLEDRIHELGTSISGLLSQKKKSNK